MIINKAIPIIIEIITIRRRRRRTFWTQTETQTRKWSKKNDPDDFERQYMVIYGQLLIRQSFEWQQSLVPNGLTDVICARKVADDSAKSSVP